MTQRLVCTLAVLLSAALLVCISRPHVPSAAYAGSQDEDVWQGTVSIVSEDHIDINEKASAPYVARHHVNRSNERITATYTGIRAQPEPRAEGTSWAGAAHVNMTIIETTYTLEEETITVPDRPESKTERGFEMTTSGSTSAEGVARFSRYPDPDNPGKATCTIEVDAQEGWHDRPELKVMGEGHSWLKSTHAQDNFDNKQKTPRVLAPEFRNVGFDCAPDAKSYSGEKRTQNSDGTSTEVINWNIHHGPFPETEVELIPATGYDHWRPQAGEDEDTLGNFIDVRVIAHKKGDPAADPPKKVLKYKIELEDTSKEKGVDLNWPPQSQAKDTYDMKIDKDNPWIKVTDKMGGIDLLNERQHAETKEEGLTDFTVTVDSYDWGGRTKLRVTAELEDHTSVVGHVQNHPEQEELFLPKDDDHNHLPDSWEHEYGLESADASADEDHLPSGDGDRGDTIALYDEYRGFHVSGQHERLSPKRKDLFIWDQDDVGIGVYGETGILTHVIYENEYFFKSAHLSHQVVTPNGTYGDVCALWLHEGALDPGVIGETARASAGPCNVESITINSAGAGGPEQLQSGIAHELSHATNVDHHGPDGLDYDIGDALCRVPDHSQRPGTKGTMVTVNYPCSKTPRDKNGKAIGPGQQAYDCWEVAVKGGKYSGNDQCWMRYDQTNFYEDPAGNCEWQHNGQTVRGRVYGKDLPGMIICDNPRGTGVNDPSKKPNKAGDATVGDCKHHLCLKHR
jgi:hypothetical protein